MNHEHIWPQWSHKYLPKGKKFYWALLAVERPHRSDVRFLKHAGDPYDRQVKAVDERCNNGWMRKEIEDKAKPVLIGLFAGAEKSTRVSEEEQGLIARWIALRAIVSEYDDGSPRITHHAQRRMLWQKHTIPKDTWRVWIANYEGKTSAMLWQEHPFLMLPTHIAERKRKKSGEATYVNSQVLTYVIGKLLIHVMHCPNPRTLRIWNFPPQVAGKLRRIWPPTGLSIVWPPPTLTDEDAAIIGSAFKRFLSNLTRDRLGLPTF